MRWSIVGFSSIGLAIAYLDRSALSVALPFMTQDFHISPSLQGVVLSSFFWSYALLQIPSGWLLDKIGPRIVYPVAVGWWSIWTALMAFTNGVASAIAFRIGLGIGEAPILPANVKVVSKWFPRRERAFASALFDMGQQIGVALSVPVVTLVAVTLGWRASFVIIGILGFLWIFGWMKLYRSPEEHPRVNPAELAYIQSDQAEMVVVDPQAPPRIRIRQLMRYSQVWALMTGYICRSMAGAFFLTWYPSYLLNERGFSEEAFGMVGAIPALAAVASTVLGGIVSDRLLASGRSADFARKVPIIGGLLISACIAFAPFLESDLAVMILLTVSNAAIQFSGAAVLSLPAEVAPSPDLVGSIAGFQNFGSQVGSIISPIAIGLFLTFSDGSYVGPLVLAGMSCIAGALVYGFWVKVKPVQTFTSTRSSTT